MMIVLAYRRQNDTMCVCVPILVTTYPEWLSGTEPLPHTSGAVRPSSLCLQYFCMHMYSFAGVIRRMPPLTFSDSAITDRHSDTTISSSELTGCGYPGLLDRKNRSNMWPRLLLLLLYCCFTSTVNL